MEAARAAQRERDEASDDDEMPDAPTSIKHARKSLKKALRRRVSDKSLSDGQTVTIVTALLDAADAVENA
jgi:hypothetical protein